MYILFVALFLGINFAGSPNHGRTEKAVSMCSFNKKPAVLYYNSYNSIFSKTAYAKDSIISPSLMFTPEEISHLRTAVENSVEGTSLHTAGMHLIQKCEGGLNLAIDVYNGNNPSAFYEQILKQAALARDLALGYALTGNGLYAEKAAEIIKTWAEQSSGIILELTSGTGMLIARSTYPLLCAYDLLKNTPYFDVQSRENVNSWLSGFIPQIKSSITDWEQNNYYNRQDYQNHVVAHSMGLLALGYALEDKDLINFALQSKENPRNIYELITGCIFMEGDEVHHREPANAPPPENGEIYDRYRHHTASNRGLQYAHLTTTLLTISAKICANNGLNLFDYTAPAGENLRLPFEYYADYYRLMDACIKRGFYCGETSRIGKAGDNHGMFELAYRYYPDSEPIKNLLHSGSFNRGTDYMDILGYTRFYSAFVETGDVSTGTKQPEKGTYRNVPVSVYPNPSNSFLLIEVPECLQHFHIELYDGSGKLVLKRKGSFPGSKIDLKEFNRGTYVIRIFNNETIYKDTILIH